MGELLSRESILSATDLPTSTVEVPEWGGNVRVRGLTAAERDAFEALITQSSMRDGQMGVELRWQNARATLAAWTIVDTDGRRVFTDEEIEELGQKSASALQRIFAVAQKLSGFTDQDVKELVEDFVDARSGASSSG